MNCSTELSKIICNYKIKQRVFTYIYLWREGIFQVNLLLLIRIIAWSKAFLLHFYVMEILS